MDPEPVILYSILGAVLAEYLWDLYLGLRQHAVYSQVKDVPKELVGALSPEELTKARLYGLDKSTYSFFRDFYSVVISMLKLWFLFTHVMWGWSGSLLEYTGLAPGEIKQSAVFLIIMNTISTVVFLPFSVYNTFVLEEKHGFNKQTCGFFIKDKLKMFLVSLVIVVPLTSFAIYIVKVGGDYFFVYLWLMTMVVTLFLMTIYPEYIAPLFDNYTPLPEGNLKKSIEELAASIKFPLYKLYLVEGSKRSAHSNAYLYGFFNNKRIVLFDTLLKDYSPENKAANIDKKGGGDATGGVGVPGSEPKGCSDDEVLAVLAHELGHWRHSHVVKNIVIMQVNLFLQFLAFGLMFKYSALYRAFGFTDEEPVVVGFIVILMYIFSPYNTVLSFFMTALSRKFEFEADQFACGLGKTRDLGSGLIKLHKDNLSFPVYDWLYSTWYHSHPPLLERLAALRPRSKKEE